MKKPQSGFTLVEIAIVLLIVGLLLGGVLKGQELIDSAKAAYNDEEARWDYLVEAEQTAIGEHYVQIPTYQSAGTYLLKAEVKDLFIPVFGPDSYKYAYIEE